MERWAGRTALVTGASAGIGRAITIQLLHHGVNVVACARRAEPIEGIKDEVKAADTTGRLLAVKCDVSKEEEVLAMFDTIKASDFKGVDICINNAAIGDMEKLSEGDANVWKRVLEVNVLGLSICTREALKSMKERGVDDGHVIHISSTFGHIVMNFLPMYTASKFAVRALTEGLRQELAEQKSGIRVTAISPGAVKTTFGDRMGAKEFYEAYYKNNPFLKSEDVSASVIHALSAPKHVQIHDVLVYSIDQAE